MFTKRHTGMMKAPTAVLYATDLDNNLQVCPKCGHHNRLNSRQRLDLLPIVLIAEGQLSQVQAQQRPDDDQQQCHAAHGVGHRLHTPTGQQGVEYPNDHARRDDTEKPGTQGFRDHVLTTDTEEIMEISRASAQLPVMPSIRPTQVVALMVAHRRPRSSSSASRSPGHVWFHAFARRTRRRTASAPGTAQCGSWRLGLRASR